jgi:hypothetical protein
MAYRFVAGAGHRVQQERTEEVVKLIREFLKNKWAESETVTNPSGLNLDHSSFDEFESYTWCD